MNHIVAAPDIHRVYVLMTAPRVGFDMPFVHILTDDTGDVRAIIAQHRRKSEFGPNAVLDECVHLVVENDGTAQMYETQAMGQVVRAPRVFNEVNKCQLMDFVHEWTAQMGLCMIRMVHPMYSSR
ncbi:hypothetical protein HGA91_05615 [candidate division WWE3 bacterium]|nr:hypothetical protein [candidate division WWE3 bacterium]